MSKLRIYTISVFIIVLIFSCKSSSEPETNYNPPEDHLISKEGKMHKPGLNDPVTNCASCHGSELRGSETAPSCYECHGKKW
jgi:hypothetical protein